MPLLRTPVRIRWWIFAYMFAFAMLAYVQRTSISVAAERIEPELHLSQTQVGWLMWSFTVAYTVMQVPAGAFGMRFGARATYVVLGLVGFVACLFGNPQKPDTAAALTRYSCWSLGIGIAIAVGYWFVRRLLD
jgi:sugar phosphate permease